MALIAWFRYAAARAIAYAVREHDVIVRSGVFWKRETVQPILRIQHVERAQGPLDKRFGLAKLKLFSAGTGHSTFEIPGLDAETALRIQSFLLEHKAGGAERDDGLAPPREDAATGSIDA
jgi:membrane protein YdbS with pleckstrin-like domain